MAVVQVRAMDVRLDDHHAIRKLTDQEPQDVIVTEGMTVADAIRAILSKIGTSTMSRLTILSHGFNTLVEGNEVPDLDVSVQFPGPKNVSRAGAPISRVYGGYGLEFGSDQLNMTTVAPFAWLNGRFTEGGIIVLFGCAAADTGPYVSDTLSGDGPGLMKAIARLAGVPVRASDKFQDVPINWYLGTADRGPWAGRTFLFYPDGRQVDESSLPMSVY